MTVLWWVREDLRLADNPALTAAADHGPVVAVHVEERIDGARPLGGAARWWLHHSLTALAADLRMHGIPLVLATGDPREVVLRLADELDASAVVWNRRYHQPSRDADVEVKASVSAQGRTARSYAAHVLHEPWAVRPLDGDSYRVYSAFARAVDELPPPREPLPVPDALRGPKGGDAQAAGVPLTSWCDADAFADALARRAYLPTAPDWSGGLAKRWTPGERGGHERLDHLGSILERYATDRDRPDRDATTHLSPHLRFGEVSPFQLWHRSLAVGNPAGGQKLRRELLWRDFAWHRRYHLPELATRSIHPAFDRFAWVDDPETLRAWQRGRTGVPLVDAGMRELRETGYMHNRVRMVVASFLVKNLRQDWRLGEQWFWDCLVDGDEAANPFNWQWSAGSGDDAAPYVRIFNPERQRERFDPDDVYVRRWAPETLGPDAPPPIVDLAQSRREALAAFEEATR